MTHDTTNTKTPQRHSRICSFSLDPALLEKLDAWRWQHKMPRSQAIAAAIEKLIQEKNDQ